MICAVVRDAVSPQALRMVEVFEQEIVGQYALAIAADARAESTPSEREDSPA
ncbi:hypothetical protein PUR57_01575 [Streptomyces sp. JV176]|uniref:hypothetical protein n=1 Tax=unclassified Streptomyces TaxID=2593676 RepID=UPI002E78A486|nr:hypothetical protein [Streptomyces sp. JV176]MEE1797390.1 hypothetical protein [Streptomyces sp. JV176]